MDPLAIVNQRLAQGHHQTAEKRRTANQTVHRSARVSDPAETADRSARVSPFGAGL